MYKSNLVNKRVLKQALILTFTLMTLTACSAQNETTDIATYLTPSNTYDLTQNTVRPQLDKTAYRYWTQHKINASNELFWDMSSNTGDGCGLENFTYCTQIVAPQDLGLEVGYPIEEYIKDMVTERQVLFTMSEIELGEWKKNADGKNQCYDAFTCEMYQTTDKTGRTWDFFLYNYTLKTEEEPDGTHSFNLIGVTPYYDEWFTIELTGNVPVKVTDKEQVEQIMAIYTEFVEIYGFTGQFIDRPSNEATAHYLIGF